MQTSLDFNIFADWKRFFQFVWQPFRQRQMASLYGHRTRDQDWRRRHTERRFWTASQSWRRHRDVLCCDALLLKHRLEQVGALRRARDDVRFAIRDAQLFRRICRRGLARSRRVVRRRWRRRGWGLIIRPIVRSVIRCRRKRRKRFVNVRRWKGSNSFVAATRNGAQGRWRWRRLGLSSRRWRRRFLKCRQRAQFLLFGGDRVVAVGRVVDGHGQLRRVETRRSHRLLVQRQVLVRVMYVKLSWHDQPNFSRTEAKRGVLVQVPDVKKSSPSWTLLRDLWTVETSRQRSVHATLVVRPI